ncbi:hypothetical protein J0X14_07715 [Muricauda sp. CAU 1633]|uniref:hypothetical protein n=1 Tax=Allomuricauda sp. CAU 1633 TaxID=2816036 RepID=UPI001A8F741B|nr:hypothetical protein [Muricauda sp. CAU 1633]MBO0322178.1 hypothetical protein [Muricauda sp. CAU 1633]
MILNQSENHWVATTFFFSSLVVFAFLVGNAHDFSDSTEGFKESLMALDSKEKVLRPLLSMDNKTLMSHKKDLRESETPENFIKRMLPKVLGTILILITAFASLNSFFEIQATNIDNTAGKLFLVAMIPLILSLNQDISNALNAIMVKAGGHDWYPFLLAVILVLGITLLGFFNEGGNDDDLIRLFFSLLFLAFLFFLVTTSYSKIILRIKYRFGGHLVLSIMVATFLFYCALLVEPRIPTNIELNPLTTINVCLLSIFTLLTMLRALGKKTGLPVVSMTLLALVTVGIMTASKSNFDHYDVSTTAKTIEYTKRPSLETYIKQWIQERRPSIEAHSHEKPFIVVFVSSEGGGSRAGLWAFLVNSYLYEENKAYFDRNLFSMTGASGGMVGNAMFYAVASHNYHKNDTINLKNPKGDVFTYKASSIYFNDYLSTSVAALLGRDFFQSILGIWDFCDRSSLLELEWEKGYSAVFKDIDLGEEFLSKQPPSTLGTPPLLIINTVNVQKGNYSLISPVDFSKDYRNLNVFNDFLNDFNRDSLHKSKSIKYSTAMSLSARFPFLSPVGRVKGVGQFMDAGYYDNIGGTVTRRLYNAFEAIVKNDPDFKDIRDKMCPLFLTIGNMDSNKKKPSDQDSVPYRAQIVAPAVGVLNATFWQAEEMKKTFGDEYLVESKKVTIILDKETREALQLTSTVGKEVTPELPLGRHLSRTVIQAMEENLADNKEAMAKLKRLLQEIED